MNMNLHTKIGGVFKITAVTPDGTERVLADWFPNLVVNSGLDRGAVAGTWTNARIAVGTGTAAPTPGDMSMQNLRATSSDVTESSGADPTDTVRYARSTRTYRFQPGTASGNLSEIGLIFDFQNNTTYGLYARSLIKDGSGNPTTITVLPEETLLVTYEVRLYMPTNDITGSVVISGVTYGFTARPGRRNWGTFANNGANVGFVVGNQVATSFARGAGASLGTVTSDGVGGAATGDSWPGSQVVSPYVPGNYFIQSTCTWPAANGNASFWFLYMNGGRGGWQILFNQGIPKTNLNQLTITFRISWSAL